MWLYTVHVFQRCDESEAMFFAHSEHANDKPSKVFMDGSGNPSDGRQDFEAFLELYLF